MTLRAREATPRALRTAHLLRRSRPADKELQIAGLLRAIVPPPEGAALGELLGERVAALVRLTGEDAQLLREAEEESGGLELDAGVLEDWRPVLELVAAAHRAPADH
ncbi:hypothetical protein GUY61_21650 [Streptomyces sp. GC420]|nr:hypothetical protein [Streptomyces sp. GC420]